MVVGTASHGSSLLPALRGRASISVSRFAARSAIQARSGHPRPAVRSRDIDQVAIDFPELVIVCGHIGYPWTNEMIAVCDKHENVYIDTSAYTARRYPAELVTYMSGKGRQRVMFGTNYPMITPVRALEGLADLGLDEQVTELFLGENAEAGLRNLRNLESSVEYVESRSS